MLHIISFVTRSSPFIMPVHRLRRGTGGCIEPQGDDDGGADITCRIRSTTRASAALFHWSRRARPARGCSLAATARDDRHSRAIGRWFASCPHEFATQDRPDRARSPPDGDRIRADAEELAVALRGGSLEVGVSGTSWPRRAVVWPGVRSRPRYRRARWARRDRDRQRGGQRLVGGARRAGKRPNPGGPRSRRVVRA